MNYMVILAAALLIVAAGVASGDYDDPTISEDWPSIRGNFTAEDFNVSVNWSEVEIARTDDVFIKGHKVPEWGEAAAAWILNRIYRIF